MLKFAELGSNYLLRLKCEAGKGYKVIVITVWGSSFWGIIQLVSDHGRDRERESQERQSRKIWID